MEMMIQSGTVDRAVQQAHREATRAPISQVASVLQDLLSRRLTAYIVGVGDGKTVARWANGDVAEIRDHEIEKKLRATYEIAQLLLTGDAAQTVKAWFLGLNPELNDVSPSEALRDGQLKESLAAARAFVAGG
jgi:hypothetical protein